MILTWNFHRESRLSLNQTFIHIERPHQGLMKEKLEVVVVVINQIKQLIILGLFMLCSSAWLHGQEYTKRVLEATEVDILMGYYQQAGDHAAVSGGIGNEALTDISPSVVVSVPINSNEILSIDATVSAYTSASSSNINPFDSKSQADPFVASSGASSHDVWFNTTIAYSKYSNDRNKINSVNLSISNEFDYSSVGIGGTTSRLFNEKNTELSLSANVFVDQWRAIYPYEIRLFEEGGPGSQSNLISQNTIFGDPNYRPEFKPFSNEMRTSVSSGFVLSQILSKSIQGSILFDVVYQSGLLSTPFQRVYFSDVPNSYIGNFQLGDAIEQLPDNRIKLAFGGRLNTYINEFLVARSYLRYYQDNWGINSLTAQIELPVKIRGKYTLYPSYRYYSQSKADYFAPYEIHNSSEDYYTSDYDLSSFDANQYGIGFRYTDILSEKHISVFAIKSFDLNFSYYERNIGFNAFVVSTGLSMVLDP